ncbi:sugar 3,4-ketoisomerase [Hymenobacter psoromatis]|uniref:sugar 3,4-ketoisomerase n=1 Tax=Hymenobacter psoromatis TaxID=1484116 RepID=UPI001CBBBAF7|nr:FdtA/QdtA family cupin domain-containing protein [Hymenobacter psoromatis]
MTLPYLFSLPTHGAAAEGWLTVAEATTLPFAVRRAYWITDVPAGQVRGRHTHRTLEQVFMALSGTLRITVECPGFARHTFELSQASQALYVPAGSWREVQFGAGAVLLCLASQEYDEADYEREPASNARAGQ